MPKLNPNWYSGDAQELHVLAVDDSLVDRKVIERLLKISCCKVTAVESGRSALQYLGLDGEESSVEFDDMKVNLIITDYSMPGMTGFELLQKIKGSSKLREIPVVIMSSENILARIDRCLEEGAQDYLVKPVKLADVQRIRDCILKSDDKNSDKDCISKIDEKNASETTRKRKIIDGPYSASPAPTPSTLPTLNCDKSLSPISISMSLNCDNSSTPMSVSVGSLQLLAKRPSLMVASD